MIDKSMKILVVDDGKMTRNIVQNFLQELGFTRVYLADDGKNGLKLLEEQVKAKDPYKLLISDIKMPRMDGLELLETIRAHRLLGALKVILLTTVDDSETILKAVDMGADNYITKPATQEKLKEKLTNLFGEI